MPKITGQIKAEIIVNNISSRSISLEKFKKEIININ